MNDLIRIAGAFRPADTIADVRPHGTGNINRTFLVTCGAPATERFILQRINTHVFPRPELVMNNIRSYTTHASRKLRDEPLSGGRRWVVPEVLATRDGRDAFIDADGSFWRALSFIDRTVAHEILKTPEHAREIGTALGIFHSLVSDLPGADLSDTLEGFHVTPLYLERFDAAVPGRSGADSPELSHAMRFVESRREFARVLEDARAAGRLFLRPIHGDPKVNNIMFDEASGRAVSMIDLDTVKPGLVQYDIGDCLRSGCNPLGEETDAWEEVRFDTAMAREILQGYLGQARGFLTRDDVSFIADSARLIAFELGLRFLTDHIQGDIYFRADVPGRNLRRALVQFRLCESIEEHLEELSDIAKRFA